jgi:four helix bundle protein
MEEVLKWLRDFSTSKHGKMTNQMQRAAVSVAANIAEGSGRRTIADYIRFLYIAKGSLTELEYYIHLAHRLGYLADADYQKLNALQDETARVLTGFIRFKQQEAEAQHS